mgnify:CR=1 FL=1
MRASLGELGTVITGNTPSKQELKYWASSDIPFIKPDVMNQDGITELQTANEYVSEIARSKARIVGKSVVLVTCIGTIGKVCLTGRECAFNQQINAIIPNDRVLPEYLAYCIYYNRPKLTELANAPVVPIINKRQFEDFSVNIEENVERQGSIVTILKEVDRLICYRRQQLQKLDELVKARFVEMFGNPEINPNNYPVCQLSDFIVFLTSGSRGWAQYCANDGTEWFITIKNVKDCHIETDNMQPINAPDNAEAKRTRVQEGDLLISITADLGRTGVVTKEIAEHGAYINQHLTCIRLKQDVLNPLYVAYFMESPAGKEQFESKNQSAVKAGLNFNSINSLRLMVPPLDDQNAFVDFIKQTDKSKAVIQKALDEAQLLFDSLMQKYFQ